MKIEINDEIIKKLEKKIEGTAFTNINEYIDYILRDIVSEEEFTEEDEEKVKERLRALGYME